MLLSRVAEQLYWAARYLERAEGTARVVREHTNLLVDLPTSVPLGWDALLAVPDLRAAFETRYERATEAEVITFLLADRDNPSSIVATVAAARDDLRAAREVLPREAWQAVNDLYLYVVGNVADAVARRGRSRFLERVITENQRIVGILTGTMSRDEAYQFLRLGRNLERADMTTRVLDVRAVALLITGEGTRPAHDDVQWAAVLRSLSALQMYHRRCRSPVEGPLTVDFLLRDADFPRSVRHCLGEVEAVLGELPRSKAVRSAARAAVRTLEDVADAPLTDLHDGLDDVQAALAAVHDAAWSTYFAPPAAAPGTSAVARRE
jgi:uncharacterized alpha-E superfamily protein